jgi:phage terminase small subunit
MKLKPKKIKPPKNLSTESKELWHYVYDNFELERHHVVTLKHLCKVNDRADQASKDVDAKGLTFIDKYGQIKSNPSVQIERDSRIAFARLLRELNLDTQSDTSRPPALKYARHSQV